VILWLGRHAGDWFHRWWERGNEKINPGTRWARRGAIAAAVIAIVAAAAAVAIIEPTRRAARHAGEAVRVAERAAADQAAANNVTRHLAERQARQMDEDADRQKRSQVSLVAFRAAQVAGPDGGVSGARLLVTVDNASRHDVTDIRLVLDHGPAMRGARSPVGSVEVSTHEPIPACTTVTFEVPLDTNLRVLNQAYDWHILMPDNPSLMIFQDGKSWLLHHNGSPALAEDSPGYPGARAAEAENIGKIIFREAPALLPFCG